MSFLQFKEITKIYPNGTLAVNNTSLEINNGEFMVFVGPSGCGKSTMLRMWCECTRHVLGTNNSENKEIRKDKHRELM